MVRFKTHVQLSRKEGICLIEPKLLFMGLHLHDGSCGDLSVTYIHAYAYLDHSFLQ